MKTKLLPTAFAVLLSAVCAACFTEAPAPADTGKTAVHITIQGGAARTIVPQHSSKYILQFASAAATREPVVLEGTTTAYLELEEGEWTITATGYTEIDGAEYAAVEGSTTVTVNAGQTLSISIAVTVKQPGADGWLSWDYVYTIDQEVISASLAYWLEGQAPATIDLVAQPQGRVAVPPGFYQVKGTATTAEDTVTRTEIARVYSNMETVVNWANFYLYPAKNITASGTVTFAPIDGVTIQSVSLTARYREKSLYIGTGFEIASATASDSDTDGTWEWTTPQFLDGYGSSLDFDITVHDDSGGTFVFTKKINLNQPASRNISVDLTPFLTPYTANSFEDLRAYTRGLPLMNSPESPYPIVVNNLSLASSWGGMVNTTVYGEERYVSLDLSGCWGDSISDAYGECVVSIVLPASVKSFYTSLLKDPFPVLKSLVMPGVTSLWIGNCPNLERIEIPSLQFADPKNLYVVDITTGYYAFLNCPKLSQFIVGDNPTFGTLEDGKILTAKSNAVIIDPIKGLAIPAGATALISYPSARGAVALPAEIKVIVDCAFYENSRIESLDAPGVQFIGLESFGRCSNLTTVNMPDILYIGSFAFDSSGLTSVSLPAVMRMCDSNPFMDCVNLTQFTIDPASEDFATALDGKVLTSKDGAIWYAYPSAGPRIVVPANVTRLGDSALAAMYNLKTLVLERSESPTALSFNALGSVYTTTSNSRSIYVPDAVIDDYKTLYRSYGEPHTDHFGDFWQSYDNLMKPLSELPSE